MTAIAGAAAAGGADDEDNSSGDTEGPSPVEDDDGAAGFVPYILQNIFTKMQNIFFIQNTTF